MPCSTVALEREIGVPLTDRRLRRVTPEPLRQNSSPAGASHAFDSVERAERASSPNGRRGGASPTAGR